MPSCVLELAVALVAGGNFPFKPLFATQPGDCLSAVASTKGAMEALASTLQFASMTYLDTSS